MAKAELEKKALKILDEQKDICSIKDLAVEMNIARSTVYYNELDKSDIIKEAMERNKSSSKRKVRNKWQNSDNATLQIAWYRLMADEDETARLNSAKLELEHSGKLTVMPSVKIGSKDLELNIGDDVD